jgi:hypothetical protein
MNGDGVFDEQTDFSFLNVSEQKSSKDRKDRKDRSVQLGDVRIDIQLTYIRTDEQKAKIGASRKGKPGHPHTAESKAKISAGNKGKKQPREAVEAMRIRLTGKKQSEQTVQKRIKKVLRPLMTPNGVFPSRKAAAEYYKCGQTHLWNLMNADIGFYNLEKI